MARMAATDRRRQITEAALGVVGSHGLLGATTPRVAAAAGISPAAIYKHFANRDELLRAALELLYDQIEEILFESSADLPIIDRLRAVETLHSSLVSSGGGSFVHPLFEFLAAPPEAGLREAHGARQLRVIERLAAMIEQAKSEGALPVGVDSEQIAWELHAVFWAEDISYLLGLTQFVSSGRSRTIVNNILARLTTGGDGLAAEEGWQDDLRGIRRLLACCPMLVAEGKDGGCARGDTGEASTATDETMGGER